MSDTAGDSFGSLKTRLTTLLTKDVSPDEAKAVSAEVAKAADALEQYAALANLTDWWLKVLQSAPFYFFFGLLLLLVAFGANAAQLNSSLTFLIAMLGVAIVLYGTGSQAAGTLGSDPEKAKALLDSYLAKTDKQKSSEDLNNLKASIEKASGSGIVNVAIAGGAAVLTAVFGYGVVWKQNEIRQVFRDWDRYSIVRVDLCVKQGNACVSIDDLASGIRTPLINSVFLETDLGRRAYARPIGNNKGLEFIVFDRDRGGSTREVRLGTDDALLEAFQAKGYQIHDQYFLLDLSKNCIAVSDEPIDDNASASASSAAIASSSEPSDPSSSASSAAPSSSSAASTAPPATAPAGCGVVRELSTEAETSGLPFFTLRATVVPPAVVAPESATPVTPVNALDVR